MNVEEYIRRAEDAERQARRAGDESERTALLRIASVWRELATKESRQPAPGER